MANYDVLKTAIQNAVDWDNNNKQISGNDMLAILLSIINNTVSVGYLFAGVATPDTNPGTPDQNVFYIAGPGTYSNFSGAVVGDGYMGIFKYNGSWSIELIPVSVYYEQVEFDTVLNSFVRYDTGGLGSGSTTNRTDFIDCSGVERIKYARGLATSGTTLAGMAFYDSEKTFISGQRFILSQAANGYEDTEIDVPGNAAFVRFSFWKNVSGFYVTFIKTVDVFLQALQSAIQELAFELNQIQTVETEQVFEKITGSFVRYDTGGLATASTADRTDYLDVSGITKIKYARGLATSSSTLAGMAFYDSEKTFISGQRFILSQAANGYEDTEIDVPSGSVYARFSMWKDVEGFYISFIEDLNTVVSETERRVTALEESPAVGFEMLRGKKISIIGDSISCFGTESQTRTAGYNAPFWIVKSVDVGQTIQSWVTWLDVYTSVDSTTPTNKTIGGVTLTAEMIGTLQSFTPVTADVGKAIGVPRWASSYTTKPWWQVLIDKVGAELCNNASWSGSRIIPIPEGNARHDAFVLSEAYSEYTLGRVCNRDDEGNTITPDVIIIYRGTNDLSAEDPEGGSGSAEVAEDLTTPDMISFTEITDEHNFTQGYIWTILKLRERYPNAYIVLCTLNMFKRISYAHFPTNNGTYTLPEYNNKIREIANLMGCGLIELDKDGITFENCYPTYISDSASKPTHPNTEGHRVMGERAVIDLRYCLQVSE